MKCKTPIEFEYRVCFLKCPWFKECVETIYENLKHYERMHGTIGGK